MAFKTQSPTGLAVNLSSCKYAVLRTVCEQLGFAVVNSDEDQQQWDVYWTDLSVSIDRVAKLLPYQKLNHFPGMLEICRKAQLCQHLQRMAKRLPSEYNFAPPSYALPEQLSEFVASLRKNKQKAEHEEMATWIVKPSAGAMGRGILLVQHEGQLMHSTPSVDITKAVAQLYIAQPLLLDGFKFDMRIYVLVSSVDPLEVYLYDEGIARFATEPYCQPSSKNLDTKNMHLTNYSINKYCKHFVHGDGIDRGSKRLLSAVLDCLKRRGVDTSLVWKNVADLIIKTLLPIQPHLAHTYYTARSKHASWDASAPETDTESQCFELLGFDIMLDYDVQPWLLEVNHSPSYGTETQLDMELKSSLLADAMRLLGLDRQQRQQYENEQRAAQQTRLYANPYARMRWSSQSRSGRHGWSDTLEPTSARPQDTDVSPPRLRKANSCSGAASCTATCPAKHASTRECGAFKMIYPAAEGADAKRYQKIQECAAKLYPNQRCSCYYCMKRKRLQDLSYDVQVMSNQPNHLLHSFSLKPAAATPDQHPHSTLPRRPQSAAPILSKAHDAGASRTHGCRPMSAPTQRPGNKSERSLAGATRPNPQLGDRQASKGHGHTSILDGVPSNRKALNATTDGSGSRSLCRPAADKPASAGEQSPRARSFQASLDSPACVRSIVDCYKYLTPAMKRLLAKETRAAHAISQRYITKVAC